MKALPEQIRLSELPGDVVLDALILGVLEDLGGVVELDEFDDTAKIFENPDDQRVEDYITGKFG